MLRAAAVVLAILGLLAPAGSSAAAEGHPFPTLVKEFAPKVSAHGEPAARANLVARVAGFDNPEGVKLLVAGLAALVDRLDRDLANYAALRKRYEEVNTPLDVANDDFKTRTELQNRLAEEDAKQRDDGKVLEAFRAAIVKYQDTQSLSTLAAEVRTVNG